MQVLLEGGRFQFLVWGSRGLQRWNRPRRSLRSSGPWVFLLVFLSVENISCNGQKRSRCLPLGQRSSKKTSTPSVYSILFQMWFFFPDLSLPSHRLWPTFRICQGLPGQPCSSSGYEGHRALLLPGIMLINWEMMSMLWWTYLLVSLHVLVDLARVFFT